ncbi:hypothetical protein XELAEV_18026940mg, partial [Xenopus laevis]
FDRSNSGKSFDFDIRSRRILRQRSNIEALGHKATLQKLQNCKQKFNYLGHCRITAICNLAHPRHASQFHTILEMLGYCRQWISNYSELTRPLLDLLKQENFYDSLIWSILRVEGVRGSYQSPGVEFVGKLLRTIPFLVRFLDFLSLSDQVSAVRTGSLGDGTWGGELGRGFSVSICFSSHFLSKPIGLTGVTRCPRFVPESLGRFNYIFLVLTSCRSLSLAVNTPGIGDSYPAVRALF